MGIQLSIGGIARDHFPIWESDGITKKSGESSFTVSLWHEDSLDPITPVLSEIGTTGEYSVSFTPDKVGVWTIEVIVGYNGDSFGQLFQVNAASGVSQLNAAYNDATNTLSMDAWLERGQVKVAAASLVSCSVTVYDSTGTEVFTAASAAPGADGVFRISQNVVLVTNRVYSAEVSVIDDQGTVRTNQSMATAG